MKTLSIMIIIFLLSACGQTTLKRKSSKSALTACPTDFVVAYNTVSAAIYDLQKTSCLSTGYACNVTSLRNTYYSTRDFKNKYVYQKACNYTDTTGTHQISVNDFDKVYGQMQSILNAE